MGTALSLSRLTMRAVLARGVVATTLTSITTPVDRGSRRNAEAAVRLDEIRARERADAILATRQQAERTEHSVRAG